MDFRSPTPWMFGGLLVLGGVGLVYALQAGACTPKIAPGARILSVGDSLLVGLKTPMAASASKSGCDFVAFAESGTTMQRWLGDAQVDAALNTFAPTLVLVSLGTNDSKGSTPAPVLAAQVQKMRQWLTSTGARLVWVLPPKLPFPDRVSPIVQAAGIDAFVSSALPLPQPDGVHTTGRGYAGWTEHIWAFLLCSPAPNVALSGLGSAPRLPMVPAFMARARPPSLARSRSKKASKRRRRV